MRQRHYARHRLPGFTAPQFALVRDAVGADRRAVGWGGVRRALRGASSARFSCLAHAMARVDLRCVGVGVRPRTSGDADPHAAFRGRLTPRCELSTPAVERSGAPRSRIRLTLDVNASASSTRAVAGLSTSSATWAYAVDHLLLRRDDGALITITPVANAWPESLLCAARTAKRRLLAFLSRPFLLGRSRYRRRALAAFMQLVRSLRQLASFAERASISR